MSVAARDTRIVFRVAAGPRRGFGHLVRCRSLAHAMGVQPLVSLRGTPATRRVAAASGWTLVDIESDSELRAARPALLIVDDPSRSVVTRWVQRARRVGVPVVTIHDLGLAYAQSDLIVDGSVSTSSVRRGNSESVRPRRQTLLGPRFAILHPTFAAGRRERPDRHRVLIALGGGVHVRRLAARLCQEIARRLPDVDLRVARGFVADAVLPDLPAGRWVNAPHGLSSELSRAAAAVVAGGVTLYEACALGVPVVGVAVTPAQHRTIRSIARLGAAIDGGRPPATPRRIARVASAVAMLLREEDRRQRLSSAAGALIDGRGAFRVAATIRRLIAHQNQNPAAVKRTTHAA